MASDFQILDTSWQWATNGYVPSNAVEGGYEASGEKLYYCLGPYNGIYNPGKIRPGFSGCNIAYNGREIPVNTYYVMISLNPALPLTQVYSQNGSIPFDALPGARDNGGNAMYICSGLVGGGLHPGRIMFGWNGCQVPYGGSEVQAKSYYVLALAWQDQRAIGDSPSFPAGKDIDSNPLYLCRGSRDGGLQVGKYKTGWSTCNIGYGGVELPLSSFQILSYQTRPQITAVNMIPNQIGVDVYIDGLGFAPGHQVDFWYWNVPGHPFHQQGGWATVGSNWAFTATDTTYEKYSLIWCSANQRNQVVTIDAKDHTTGQTASFTVGAYHWCAN